MSSISRVTASWQNWPGAPGITQFYYQGAGPTQAFVDGVRTFFFTLSTFLPTGLTVQVNGSGDVFNDNTGAITDVWSVATTPSVVTGGGAGNYAGNAGAVINWLTEVVHGRRRLRGRTFIVPLVSTAYDVQGSLSSGALAGLNTAANGLITAGAGLFVVWAKPKPATGFAVGHVTSARVPDLAATLRSRRQ